MDNDSDIIRLRLGEERNAAFHSYIKAQSLFQEHGQLITVENNPQKRPTAGFGLTVPPEILIAAGAGFAHALGKGLGEVVWSWLKGFFSDQTEAGNKSTFIVIVRGNPITIDPSEMAGEPFVAKEK
jgi:hypothetical protein